MVQIYVIQNGYSQSFQLKITLIQVVANSKALCVFLQNKGYKVVSDGTDNHIVLVDLRPSGIDGNRVDQTLDTCNITANKNTVPGDKNAFR